MIRLTPLPVFALAAFTFLQMARVSRAYVVHLDGCHFGPRPQADQIYGGVVKLDQAVSKGQDEVEWTSKYHNHGVWSLTAKANGDEINMKQETPSKTPSDWVVAMKVSGQQSDLPKDYVDLGNGQYEVYVYVDKNEPEKCYIEKFPPKIETAAFVKIKYQSPASCPAKPAA